MTTDPKEFYVSIASRTYGPFVSSEIYQLATGGILSSSDLIFTKGSSRRNYVGKVEKLKKFFANDYLGQLPKHPIAKKKQPSIFNYVTFDLNKLIENDFAWCFLIQEKVYGGFDSQLTRKLIEFSFFGADSWIWNTSLDSWQATFATFGLQDQITINGNSNERVTPVVEYTNPKNVNSSNRKRRNAEDTKFTQQLPDKSMPVLLVRKKTELLAPPPPKKCDKDRSKWKTYCLDEPQSEVVDWYYAYRGKVRGVYKFGGIKRMLETGQLTQDCMVWNTQMDTWQLVRYTLFVDNVAHRKNEKLGLLEYIVVGAILTVILSLPLVFFAWYFEMIGPFNFTQGSSGGSGQTSFGRSSSADDFTIKLIGRRRLKETLKDPDSFQVIEEKVIRPARFGGEFGYWVKYRAKNGFGGYVVNEHYDE